MKRAIREHLADFVALLALLVVALGVGGYILTQQRLTLPAWVPVLGTDSFKLSGEFVTAKSVTPGQAQTVTIAGVDVGEISAVRLVDGRAWVEMEVERRYAPRIRRDATMLLRPKTGLEDMTVELAPGSPDAPRAPEGFVVPVQNTLPDVKFDQILASLDRDTRTYLQLLLNGAGRGLDGAGDDLAATFKRFEPGARQLRRVGDALEERRGNIRRSIRNLRLVTEAIGEKDDQLARLVDTSNTVSTTFAGRDEELRTSLTRLPGALRETRRALDSAEELGGELGPALGALRPVARSLAPTLRQTRPFLRETTPIVRDQLRPFAREVRPVVRDLRPAARDLAEVTPDLGRGFDVLNTLVNELAFNPPGEEEGYLFWNVWLNHLTPLAFGTQDAHGPLRRGTIVLSCSNARILDTVVRANPRLGEIATFSALPQSTQICPRSTAPAATTPAQPTPAQPPTAGGG